MDTNDMVLKNCPIRTCESTLPCEITRQNRSKSCTISHKITR